MEKFELNILGCGSAVPTARHNTSAQLLNLHEKLFLIDCGEGTQTAIWRNGIRISNLNHIFISHMHGDHFFGLLPLLSSLGLMLARTADLHLYIPAEMSKLSPSELSKATLLDGIFSFEDVSVVDEYVAYATKMGMKEPTNWLVGVSIK